MVTPFQKAKAEGRKLALLTAYDYPLARLLDESGIDAILVGDSLGMVVLGLPDTTGVTMEHMLHHTRAVARGVERALVIADLPIDSYATPVAALENAKRLVDAGAQVVKLEGAQLAQIEAITRAGIPLMAHLGMLPQNVRVEGGYKIKGKTHDEADALLADARAVEAAGAFAVVLELIRPPVAREITAALGIPTIGIGSGPDCDGQVLVTHDLIGLFPWFRPGFVTPATDIASAIRGAVETFTASVQASKLSPRS